MKLRQARKIMRNVALVGKCPDYRHDTYQRARGTIKRYPIWELRIIGQMIGRWGKLMSRWNSGR